MVDINIPAFNTDPPKEFFEWLFKTTGMTETRYNRLFPQTKEKLYENWLRTGGQNYDNGNAGIAVPGRS